jgi:hypothetical protein
MKPICPLAHPRVRLDVSLVETHRVNGKVRQRHVASLGSIAGDDLLARQTFWDGCEPKLARLSNRLGPDLDRLRQVIAARIPPLDDADRQFLEIVAWVFLEEQWGNRAKSKARDSSHWNELAKQERREATEAEAMALQVKSLRGNPEAYRALNNLLGHKLAADVSGKRVDHDKVEQKLRALLEKIRGGRDVG